MGVENWDFESFWVQSALARDVAAPNVLNSYAKSAGCGFSAPTLLTECSGVQLPPRCACTAPGTA